MVIKVDFDLVMSILAHNLYRLLALSLDRDQHFSDERIYEKFVANSGGNSNLAATDTDRPEKETGTTPPDRFLQRIKDNNLSLAK